MGEGRKGERAEWEVLSFRAPSGTRRKVDAAAKRAGLTRGDYLLQLAEAAVYGPVKPARPARSPEKRAAVTKARTAAAKRGARTRARTSAARKTTPAPTPPRPSRAPLNRRQVTPIPKAKDRK